MKSAGTPGCARAENVPALRACFLTEGFGNARVFPDRLEDGSEQRLKPPFGDVVSARFRSQEDCGQRLKPPPDMYVIPQPFLQTAAEAATRGNAPESRLQSDSHQGPFTVRFSVPKVTQPKSILHISRPEGLTHPPRLQPEDVEARAPQCAGPSGLLFSFLSGNPGLHPGLKMCRPFGPFHSPARRS